MLWPIGCPKAGIGFGAHLNGWCGQRIAGAPKICADERDPIWRPVMVQRDGSALVAEGASGQRRITDTP